MGCGSSNAPARAGEPGEKTRPDAEGEGLVNEDEALKDFDGEKIVYDKKTGEAAVASDPYARKENRAGDEMLFEEESVSAGEKFGAVLPFLGALVEPDKHPPINNAEPDENYALEYVYGYRTYDCRHNLHYNSKGKVVYNVAALGVVLDPKTNTQSFFGGGTISRSTKASLDQHDDDIICLGISPDRRYAVTGQVGAKPTIYIWDTDTCKMVTPKSKFRLTAKNTRAISCCSWSSDGKYVAFVDKSENKNVYVVEVETGTLKYTEPTGSYDVYDLGWSKAPGQLIFSTCGKRHINFFDFNEKKSSKGYGHGAQTFTCLTYDENGNCYAGGLDGKIYVFTGNSVSKKIPAHKGVIHTMNWVDGRLITGGSDKNLCIFDSNMNLLSKIDMGSIPRACDKQGDSILVGLRDGSICIVSESQKKVVETLIKSHHDGEVWGLEVLDSGDVLTTCDDNKLMLWNAKERKNKGVFTVNEKAGARKKYGASSMTSYPDNQCSRAVCYNPKTNEVAVATNAGEVQIRDFANMNSVKKSMEAADRWIEFMAYSPNGEYLAVGTHSQSIVVYSTDTYAKKGELKAHKSYITSLDWSKDSKYIRSNCGAYELLFFNIETMQQDPSGATNTKEMEWATHNNKIGWNVTGVFPRGTDGSHVNGVAMSANEKLIASGDDWGLVNIYRNPCREGSQAKSFRGHSEHVVRVKFGLDDQYIFSVGGQDKTMMQWKKAQQPYQRHQLTYSFTLIELKHALYTTHCLSIVNCSKFTSKM
eukprot:TRINITY_DN641_c0_g1_i1.p1 TRINITY_DN641_c0_g1~~TRINITY_DN641_c0_g1_i1.p1  ORF type:complete len:759 (-),score=97.78 TRINITY_DN641_c0_g1_i1:138-2414(-)